MSEPEFLVHGMAGRSMNDIRDYIYNGDSHDRSKVQFVYKGKTYDLFKDPNDTDTFLEGMPPLVRNTIRVLLTYVFED
jgi:hypothetical protein